MTDSDTRPAIVRAVENWSRALGAGPALPPAQPPDLDLDLGAESGATDRRPHPLRGQDRRRLETAAQQACAAYPGAVGKLIHREIQAVLDFGFRIGGASALVTQLADQVLGTYAATTERKQPG